MVPAKHDVVRMESLVSTMKTCIESVKMQIQKTLDPSVTVFKSLQIRWGSRWQERFMSQPNYYASHPRAPCYKSVQELL